ncbi:MAG: PQQ-dependent sugar dehydrogenase [Pseudohongiellaceae bacterium]
MKSLKLPNMLALLSMTLLMNSTLQAQEAGDYSLEPLIEGAGIPWGMDWLPDGDLLVTERSGTLYRVNDGESSIIDGLPGIHVNGQGGLLDIKAHPHYADNGWLYITFSSPEGTGSGSNTALMRARLDGNRLVEQEVLYKGETNTDRGQHYGSRIAFDETGAYVYFSIGDRGDHFNTVQDLSMDGGKVYRLHADGRIPADNPFVHNADAKHAIYSYGHRNPQGMDRHPETGEIWVSEHGPRGGDEINIVQPGANYGWPYVGYGINYNGEPLAEVKKRPGIEQPVWYWDPSIATAGIAFVTSDRYPELQGHLLVGGLGGNVLELLELHEERVLRKTSLLTDTGRVRSIQQGPDGYIYLGIEDEGIMRLVP